MFFDSIIIFSQPFLKRLININHEEDIKKELLDYSVKQNRKFEEINYFFIMNIIKSGDFFKIEANIINLYFEAAFWASEQEVKQKVRPKKISDIQNKKGVRVYLKLIQNTIEGLNKKYYIQGEENVVYSIELSKFLNILFEISCIKRSSGLGFVRKIYFQHNVAEK